jgi:hypothetical protein
MTGRNEVIDRHSGAGTAPMVPLPYRVVAREAETVDTVTLHLRPVGSAIPAVAPAVHDAVRVRRR